MPDNDKHFASRTLAFARESGFADSIDANGHLLVYHGTSRANARKIVESGRFKDFLFFALDRETAEKFARQAGGTPQVITLTVDPDVVIPTGGYLSARIPGLQRHPGGVWSAKAPAPRKNPDDEGTPSL